MPRQVTCDSAHIAPVCRSFDAEGDGYGRSEGFASIVIVSTDRLSEGMRSYAIINGSAVNQVLSTAFHFSNISRPSGAQIELGHAAFFIVTNVVIAIVLIIVPVATGLCLHFLTDTVLQARIKPSVHCSLSGRLCTITALNHHARSSLDFEAMMQDGRSSGLTAPNGPSQAALLRTVLGAARVDAAGVGFVSVHGTGTPLGDPIEVGALGQGLGGSATRLPLAVLSNKSTFGHTEGAAGQNLSDMLTVETLQYIWQSAPQA